MNGSERRGKGPLLLPVLADVARLEAEEWLEIRQEVDGNVEGRASSVPG